MRNTVITALCLALTCLGAWGNSSAAEAETYTNSIGMEFVLIPAGSFKMIRNARKAVITKPFYLGKYEVTQTQWIAVMRRVKLPQYGTGEAPREGNPSRFWGMNNPVEKVSWVDVQEFIKRLNAKEGHNRYRLPTSMEWEFAARGGTAAECFFTEGRLPDYAWFRDNSGAATHPVGQKKPNPYGLYDIYGNVGEWVQDYWGDLPAGRELRDYRGPERDTDPASRHVFRGGRWRSYADQCSSVFRDGCCMHFRMDDVGFRLALSPE